MFNFIEKLRAKPDGVKKQIAFVCALFCAGIIFVVWLSVIYPDFRRAQSQEAKVTELETSPFAAFSSQLSGGLSAIGTKFSELKSSLSSFSVTPVHYSATSSEVSTDSADVVR